MKLKIGGNIKISFTGSYVILETFKGLKCKYTKINAVVNNV